jgi:hypothetical protein
MDLNARSWSPRRERDVAFGAPARQKIRGAIVDSIRRVEQRRAARGLREGGG